MAKPFTYNTIAAAAEGLYTEAGSRFLAFALPATGEEIIKNFREQLRKQHHKAVHVAMGARFGFDEVTEKFSDDGEPSGTAGRPILHTLKSREITNAGILVVRYYGGKKLGVPGLINAYRLAAFDAIDHAIIKTVSIQEIYRVTCSEANLNIAIHEINRAGAHTISSEFGETCTFMIAIERAEHAAIFQKLSSVWQLQIEFISTG